jgi:hypothetical protein
VNDDGIAAGLARLMGLPSWLPRVVLRTAFVAIALAVVFAPHTAQEALRIYVNAQTERLMNIMEPLLPPADFNK